MPQLCCQACHTGLSESNQKAGFVCLTPSQAAVISTQPS